VFTSTVPLIPIEQGGTSSDPVPTRLDPGTYDWTVSYSGDLANQPTTSSCGAEVLTVFVLHIIGPAFTNGREVTLPVSCPVALCRVRITLTVSALRLAADRAGKHRRRVITLARGTSRIRKHGARKVVLRLTSAGRRFIAAHRGRISVTARMALSIHGHTAVVKRRLTLRIERSTRR
jgi:hypothetical protein